MKPPAAHVRNVELVLESLRRGQRQLSRDPRGAVESAVKQLLSLADQRSRPTTEDTPRTYRIDDLARETGTTTRNIRAYQERGLLHAPRRTGRTAVFDESHVSRLRIITSMLDRGYTSGHILEMLSAWEHGRTIGDILGLEQALMPPARVDPPTTTGLAAARDLAGGDDDLQRLADAGLVQVQGTRVRVQRPALLAAFAEMRGYGMSTEAVLAIHLSVEPLVDQITSILVEAGVNHVSHHFDVDTEPTGSDVSELVTMLVRFRELAMASVTATLDTAIEAKVEELMSAYLAQFVDPTRSAG